jgi:hypothetical protein
MKFLLRMFAVVWAVSIAGALPARAQQAVIPSREQIIFSTLNQIQDRESAFTESIKKARDGGKGVAFAGAAKRLSQQAHPYVYYETGYFSNRQSSRDGSGGYTHTITPGFKMNFISALNSLNLDGNLKAFYDGSYRSANSLLATLDAQDSFLIGRNTVTLTDTVSTNRVSMPWLGTPHDVGGMSWLNTFNAGVTRSFNRLGAELLYTRRDTVYGESGKAADTLDETWSAGGQLRVASKTRVSVDYARQRIKPYRAVASSNSHTLSLGAASVVSSKVSSQLGMTQVLTDNKSFSDSRETTFSSMLGYRLSERASAEIKFSYGMLRDQSDVLESNTSTFDFSTTRRMGFNPRLSFGYGLTLELIELPKTVYYAHKSEASTNQLNMTYAFRRWLDFRLAYSYVHNSFNYQPNYDEHSVTVKTEARF